MSAPPPLPSIDALINQEYKTSPFSTGITSDDYRGQYALHGERVRWWKGFEKAGDVQGPNGEVPGAGGALYLEQTLPDNVFAMIFDAKKGMISTEMGQIEVGSAMISCLTDEMELARGDIIVRLRRTFLRRCTLEPSGQNIDLLPHHFVSTITQVLTESGPLTPDEFRAVDKGIEWLSTPPTGKACIEYRAFQAYEFQGETDQSAPEGSDGKPLPQIGSLRLLRPGEYRM